MEDLTTIKRRMDQRKWSLGTKHYSTYLDHLRSGAARLSPEDTLCITGDIGHEMPQILPSLKWIHSIVPCTIVVIRGNHDSKHNYAKLAVEAKEAGLNRLILLPEMQSVAVNGFLIGNGTDHSEEHVTEAAVHFAKQVALEAQNKGGLISVMLNHYPPESVEQARRIGNCGIKAHLSGHIHCTTNGTPEILANGGVCLQFYDTWCRPTDNKTIDGCFFSSGGATDVMEAINGPGVLYKKIPLDFDLLSLPPPAIYPCVLEIMPDCVFLKRNPILLGVRVKDGTLHEGTPLMAVVKAAAEGEKKPQRLLEIGKATSIKRDQNPVQVAEKGAEVTIMIVPEPGEQHFQYGRHFDATDNLVSRVTLSDPTGVTEEQRSLLNQLRALRLSKPL